MAIAFRAAGTLASANNATTGVTVPYPAGVVSGDLLLIQFNHQSDGTLNVPSGWTSLFGSVAGGGGSNGRFVVLYRIAGSSEPSSVLVTATGTSKVSGIMSAYSGCDTTTPINTSATANMPTSGTTGTCPSVTTTVANTMLLHMYWDWSGTGSTTPNAADTERYDTFDSNKSFITELADKAQAATGSTGTSAATFSTTISGGLAATIALAPLAAIAPVADFTGTPTSGTAPLSVTFTDASTNTPTSWAWDFGDGATSSSQNPSHSYTAGGVYTVALTATNATGSNTKTRTAYISVTEAVVYATGGGLDIF